MAPEIEFWKQEEEKPFKGWDFSYLSDRMSEEQTPWSYSTRARALMRQSESVLDMATGGGEGLLHLKSAWPAKVAVTEGYDPNYNLAKERLEPHGVTVAKAESSNYALLPFATDEFDLILNRHGAINVDEVARVLADGGTFLTQQVHGLWAHDLLNVFGAKPQWPEATPEFYGPWLERVGLKPVLLKDWTGKLTFTDVGAIVYYLKAVPWLVSGFSVETHLPHLQRLQKTLDQQGILTFTAKKYLIEAKR